MAIGRAYRLKGFARDIRCTIHLPLLAAIRKTKIKVLLICTIVDDNSYPFAISIAIG